jgi:hypothetical protein
MTGRLVEFVIRADHLAGSVAEYRLSRYGASA